MNSKIVISEIPSTQWNRYREIRLRSLITDPDSFGSNFQRESDFQEENWLAEFELNTVFVATVAEIDVGVMFAEPLEGEFGAQCWIGGCWIDPKYRGRGIMAKLFEFIDQNLDRYPWNIQGLGVFVDNYPAVTSYLKVGFVPKGDIRESRRHPGRYYQQMFRASAQQ